MTGSRLARAATAAGAAVGVGIAIALVATGVLSIPVKRDLSDASGPFLAAWERSRRGTFIVDSDYRRTLTDGRTLYSASELVQRPPDRIIRQFGGVTGGFAGKAVACSTDPAGTFSCAPNPPAAPPFEQALQEELTTLRTYFTPPAKDAVPLYQVTRAPGDGCYDLFRLLNYPDAPYGQRARFCFDAATGALTELDQHRDGGVTETQTANHVETHVTDNDFQTTNNNGFEERLDLGDPGSVTTVAPGSGPPGTAPGSSAAGTSVAGSAASTAAPTTGAATASDTTVAVPPAESDRGASVPTTGVTPSSLPRST